MKEIVKKEQVEIIGFFENNASINLDLTKYESRLTEELYIIKFYYQNDGADFNFIESDIVNKAINENNSVERYIFQNKNNISMNLDNFKISIINGDNNDLISQSDIISSEVTNEKIDVKCFSLLKNTNINITNIIYNIKEELFEPIFYNITLVEHNLNDIGNVLLGEAERNLEDGTFRIFDKAGRQVAKFATVRYGKTETRTKLE